MKQKLQEPSKQDLEEEKASLEEDVNSLQDIIANLEKNHPEQIEEINKKKKILLKTESDLENIKKQFAPKEKGTDEKSFRMMTDRMIFDTIEEFFKYHIRTHPDMQKAIEDVINERLDPESLPENKKKHLITFSSSNYRASLHQRNQEFKIHEAWVNKHEQHNPFSFINCINFRGYMDPLRLRSLLNDMFMWTLDELVDRYEIFHAAATRQEKEITAYSTGEDINFFDESNIFDGI